MYTRDVSEYCYAEGYAHEDGKNKIYYKKTIKWIKLKVEALLTFMSWINRKGNKYSCSTKNIMGTLAQETMQFYSMHRRNKDVLVWKMKNWAIPFWKVNKKLNLNYKPIF